MAFSSPIYITLAFLFFGIFCYFVLIDSGLLELYLSNPNQFRPKRNKLKVPNTINENAMPFVPSKIIESTENKDDEKKEYETNINNITDDNEIKEDTGSISPLAGINENENKSKKSFEIYNNNYKTITKNGTYNNTPDNTTTLAYFLELQSRLQHLQSLVSTDINESTFHSINTYYNSDCNNEKEKNKSNDMITDLHLNNMKLIESMIQNVVYDQSKDNIIEADTDFYNKLNDNNNNDTNWSRSKKNKRRPSIEQKLYRNIDYSLGFMFEMGIKLMNNSNIVHLITSAAVLYSCGVLYYCIEHNVNVSIFSYIFGIVLVFIVMGIGYLFNISSINKNGNEFMIAMILSSILIYFALFWISYYFNITAAIILIMAIILSYQYKHGPINAKERNFDEIWVCLLLNCGLPLFAYYLQLPEIIKLQPQIEEIIIEQSITITETNVVEIETWSTYIFNIIYYVITWIINDFWSMLDITYALEETQTETETQTIQQEQVIESQTEDGSDVMDVNEEIDNTLYWFNKLFYIFPYTLFNIILISWFITHSSMLIRNVSLYKTVNTKLLYCIEILLAYVLSIIFWYNNMFDVTFFYLMILTMPWTIGLLRHIWEHKNIQNDQLISKHAEIFNLWFFISIYLSFVYNWIYANGLFYSLFSPSLLIVVAPFYFIIQCMPQIVNEFVWATDF